MAPLTEEEKKKKRDQRAPMPAPTGPQKAAGDVLEKIGAGIRRVGEAAVESSPVVAGARAVSKSAPVQRIKEDVASQKKYVESQRPITEAQDEGVGGMKKAVPPVTYGGRTPGTLDSPDTPRVSEDVSVTTGPGGRAPAGTGITRTTSNTPETPLRPDTKYSIGAPGQPGSGSITVLGGEKVDTSRRGLGGRAVNGGASFAQRGISPFTGPYRYSDFQAGARSGAGLDRKIAPPKSIGDMIRYKREAQELERDRAFSDKTRRTDIAARTAELGGRRQAAEDKRLAVAAEQTAEDRAIAAEDRKRTKLLSDEYKTASPERKLEIEREMAVMSGKQPTRPTKKSTALTEKERANLNMKLRAEYEDRKKDPLFGAEETWDEWLNREYPDMVAEFGAKQQTSGQQGQGGVQRNWTPEQKSRGLELLRKNRDDPRAVARYTELFGPPPEDY